MLNRSRIVALLAFSTVFSALISAPALAQKPALTQNIDEKGRVPYHASASVICDGGLCPLNFLQSIPTGYRLVITDVSVSYMGAPEPSAVANYARLVGQPANANDTAGYIRYLPAPVSGGNNFYVSSSPVTYYVDGPNIPSVEIGNGLTGSIANGSISGYLVNLSQ